LILILNKIILKEIDLSEIITLDVMAPILANKSVQEKLVQYLPDSEILPKNEQELRTTLTTPQFKKAMSSFGSALQSGQLGPLMKQVNFLLFILKYILVIF
jgi:26S proteasome regulatory subunit N13